MHNLGLVVDCKNIEIIRIEANFTKKSIEDYYSLKYYTVFNGFQISS